MLIILTACALLTGCASTPRNEALERARAAYEQAKATPDISSNAPVALYEAAQSLQKAEQARDVEEMNHLSYMSERKSQIAIQLSEQKSAEKGREALGKEKDKILLQARELETKRALSLAETRALEAEQARKEADAGALAIERAKGEAQALAKQAEKARKEAEMRALAIQQAKAETEAKSLEVERARKEAEARALELEQAKKEAEAKALEAEMARAQVKETVQRKKQLENEIAALKAQRTERGIVLTLGDILFATGKSNLMPGAMRTIDKLSDFLKKYPKRNILIEGHTDSVGSDVFNLGLSQRRADAVKATLISSGIDSARIQTKGYGESYPVAGNETPAGRQQNRRVEIIITEEGISPGKVLR